MSSLPRGICQAVFAGGLLLKKARASSFGTARASADRVSSLRLDPTFRLCRVELPFCQWPPGSDPVSAAVRGEDALLSAQRPRR